MFLGGNSVMSEANKTSKLQTELGTYHLQFDEINDVRELRWVEDRLI